MSALICKPLLCFAHSGEAGPWLSQAQSNKLSLKGNIRIWEIPQGWLLLTGEGIEAALQSTTAALSQLPCTAVWNLGVALSLSSHEPGEVCTIRTVYGEKEAGKPEFQSYTTTENHQTRMDLISARDRILTPDRGDSLRPFASLVDREAWAIGRVAKQFGLPFHVIKVVSDVIGKTNCDLVRSQADHFSDLLLKNSPKILRGDVNQTFSTDGVLTAELGPDWHFSTSQSQLMVKTCEQIANRENKDAAAILAEMADLVKMSPRFQTSKPKDRARQLLEALKIRLNPMRELYRRRMENFIAPLHHAGIEMKFDRDFEQDDLTFTASVRNSEDWLRLRGHLDNFDFDQAASILRGDDAIQ